MTRVRSSIGCGLPISSPIPALAEGNHIAARLGILNLDACDTLYIRIDPKTSLFTLFDFSRRRWEGVTGYGSYNRAKPNYRHIDKMRVGKLLWKRK